MANPSSSPRASRNAPQRKVHRYIDASFTDDFGRQSKLTTASANGFARKKLDAAAHSLQLKTERREKQLRRIEIHEWRAAERSVAAEQRESEHRIRLMWRSLKTKVRPETKVRHTPPKERKRHWPYAAVALPKYDGPVIDRQGQRGVFMRMRYYSRRTAEQGVSQRVVKYCFNGAELDPDGNPYVATNVGATIDEALCGFDHLEQVNWSSAKNAKLLMHGIFAVDHRQSPDEMMTAGVRWAEETLGRFDLPYLVTLHAPPPDGDQRNWHLHILWSYRPLVRTGDHEWQVGDMLRTDLDNPAAMKLFRQIFAAVMTDVSFEAGQNQVWTARSNADRGLPHEPQVHLGGAKTNRARDGHFVADNEENHERVMRSKAAVIDDALRHADEALAKAQDKVRAIAARFARLPMLPMMVPERAIVATMTLDAPAFGRVPPLLSMPVVVPMMAPSGGHRPARFSVVKITRPIPRLSSVDVRASRSPTSIARPAGLEIASLRFHSIPPAAVSIGPVSRTPPVRRAEASVLSLPTLSIISPPHRVTITRSIALLPQVATPASMRVSDVVGVRPPPPIAALTTIDHVITRLEEVQRRDDVRRKRERDEADRARVDAIDRELAAQRQRAALDRLFVAITAEHHRVTRDKAGRYDVEPALLERHGLDSADLAGAQVQQRLTVIAERQDGEIAQIGGYLQDEPGRLRRLGEGWTLDEAAPADIRALVEGWSANAVVRSALERVAHDTATASVSPAIDNVRAQPVPAGSAWLRAREQRDRAMHDGDAIERLDDGGMVGPGRRVERPGTLVTGDRDVGSDRANRPLPVRHGSDFGR